MLIDGHKIKSLLDKYNIHIRGVIHIGAHECEERGFYNTILNINDDKIIWIDGNATKVEEMKIRGIHNIYASVVDETERDIIFNITERLTIFLNRIEKDAFEHNFWNLDIQGSELHVLRGSKELLKKCDAIYTEVNSEHVYNNCGLIGEIDILLKEHGFERVDTLWTDMKWGDALYLKINKAN
jgi:hypothetical protein